MLNALTKQLKSTAPRWGLKKFLCFRFLYVPRKTFIPKIFIRLLKILVVFCLFSKFYRKKMFASSLLCCSIFILVLMANIQCGILFLLCLCNITWHVIKYFFLNCLQFLTPRPRLVPTFFASCNQKDRNSVRPHRWTHLPLGLWAMVCG